MRAAVIEDGVVVNVIAVDALDALEGVTLVESETASIGDLYNGEAFTAPPVESPAPTEAQVVADYMRSVQKHLDATALSYGYDNIVSAVSYADEPAVARYQAEGQAFRAWRSLCWAKCEEVLAAVKAGERDAPTHAQLIDELPALSVQN
jgi:hypothetical protein